MPSDLICLLSCQHSIHYSQAWGVKMAHGYTVCTVRKPKEMTQTLQIVEAPVEGSKMYLLQTSEC